MKLFLLAWMLVACTSVIQTEYITVPLHHDPRPHVPKISEDEVSCLPKDVYQKFIYRRNIINAYVSDLEAIIDSTIPAVKK